MSKAIEKMKQIVSEMPEGKERQQAEQGIKNLEIFEALAWGVREFEVKQ
jgi:hypothetical protein